MWNYGQEKQFPGSVIPQAFSRQDSSPSENHSSGRVDIWTLVVTCCNSQGLPPTGNLLQGLPPSARSLNLLICSCKMDMTISTLVRKIEYSHSLPQDKTKQNFSDLYKLDPLTSSIEFYHFPPHYLHCSTTASQLLIQVRLQTSEQMGCLLHSINT